MDRPSFELRVAAPHLCLISIAGLVEALQQIERTVNLTPAARRQLSAYCELEKTLLLLAAHWADSSFIARRAVQLEILMRAADSATREGYSIVDIVDIDNLLSLATRRGYDA